MIVFTLTGEDFAQIKHFNFRGHSPGVANLPFNILKGERELRAYLMSRKPCVLLLASFRMVAMPLLTNFRDV